MAGIIMPITIPSVPVTINGFVSIMFDLENKYCNIPVDIARVNGLMPTLKPTKENNARIGI